MNVSLLKNWALWALLSLPTFSLFAQRQAENWHFGSGISISFLDGVPALLTESAMETPEGCVAYSDERGNLLFYTNGGGRIPDGNQQNAGFIWNRNHEVMYDMQGTEGGGFSARQSAIAFPVPGSETEHYLFTMEELEFDAGGSVPDQPQGRGLSYFIVDMTLNGGLGGVTLADQRVFVPSFEGLSATPMAGDAADGFWVVAHLPENNGFVVVPVTADGVGEPKSQAVAAETGGQIKISPNGQFLFSEDRLYTFDPTQGEVDSLPVVDFGDVNALSTTFTADSRYLYTVRTQDGERFLTRFDLDAEDILASGANLAPLGLGITYQMQIGPNRDLYFLEFSRQFNAYGLSEIQCPATDQPAFNRLLIDLTVDEDISFTGLPNYVDAIFAEPEATEDTIVVSNQNRGICPGGSVELGAEGYGEGYNWSNGDTSRVITVTMPGNYAVTITGECLPRIESFPVVEIPPPSVDIAPLDGDPGCPGDTVVLTFSTDDPILGISWPDGSEDSTFAIVNVPGDSVVLRVGTVCGRERFVYFFRPLENLTALLETDFSDPLCPGDQVRFSVLGDFIDAVIWEDGSTGPERSVVADSNQVYSATVFSACGDSTLLTADLDYGNCPLECDAQIPTLITPNRDGTNDGFKVFSNCPLEEYNLRIFNRWGQVVFSSDDPSTFWDGSINGEPQPMGLYLYRTQFRFPNNPELEQRDGEFTLVR